MKEKNKQGREDILTSSTTKKSIKLENTKTNCKKNKHPIKLVTNLSVFTANAAGLKQKVPSLKSELEHLGSGIFTLQETHYKKTL